MLKSIFGRRQQKQIAVLPGLFRKILEVYPDSFTYESLMKDTYFYLHCFLFQEKTFQTQVLFPYFGLNMPNTILASEFRDEFYPLFFKSLMETFYVKTPEELEIISANRSMDKCIIQEVIRPATGVASHLRLVVSPGYLGRNREDCKVTYGMTDQEMDEHTIRAAVALYSTKQSEHRSNHKHGGKAIALTGVGGLEKIARNEERILNCLGIDPANRKVPKEVFDAIFEKRDDEGKRLYDYLRYVDPNDIGIDIMYGYSELQGDTNPRWYMLETQIGPDNRFVEEARAMVPDYIARERLRQALRLADNLRLAHSA